MRVGWHLDGMPWDRFMRLTWRDRYLLNDELDDLIDRTNPDEGGGVRPKDMR